MLPMTPQNRKRRRKSIACATALFAVGATCSLAFAGLAGATAAMLPPEPTSTTTELTPTTLMPTSTTTELTIATTTSVPPPVTTSSTTSTSTTIAPTTTSTTTTTTTTLPPIPPDLSSSVEVSPDFALLGLFGVTVDLELRIDNSSDGESFGPVTMRIPKDPARVRAFTLTGGAGWSLSATIDASNYVLTYSPIIPAGDSSSAATVRFSLRPGLLTTRYTLSASIDTGSAGDATPNNNTDVDTIYVLI